MQETDEIKGGTIWITIYSLYGENTIVWLNRDGRVVYRVDGDYYVSEKGTVDYQTVVDFCVEWQQDYPYTLKQTGTELVFAEDEQTLMTVDLQDVSFGWMGRGYDSVRAYIDSPLREEMVLSALRLTEGQAFRKATRVYSLEMMMFEICYGGKYYDVSVLPVGAISIGYYDGEIYNYYTTNHNVVSYNLFLELFYEWRLR